jgi:hypothetical protein
MIAQFVQIVRSLSIPAALAAVTGACLLIAGQGKSDENQKPLSTMKRIGGNYVVEHISQSKDGTFYVEFHSVVATGRGDIIKLESDHMHVGIKEGDKLRISAEVTSEKDNVVEANQVLVFVPRVEGPVPVWLLSKKGRQSELGGADYLKMHAPQADYQIF